MHWCEENHRECFPPCSQHRCWDRKLLYLSCWMLFCYQVTAFRVFVLNDTPAASNHRLERRDVCMVAAEKQYECLLKRGGNIIFVHHSSVLRLIGQKVRIMAWTVAPAARRITDLHQFEVFSPNNPVVWLVHWPFFSFFFSLVAEWCDTESGSISGPLWKTAGAPAPAHFALPQTPSALRALCRDDLWPSAVSCWGKTCPQCLPV